MPPSVLLEAYVCIYLDDHCGLSRGVIDRLRSELAEPAGRDALRPWVTVLRRHQQPGPLGDYAFDHWISAWAVTWPMTTEVINPTSRFRAELGVRGRGK